MIIAKLINEAKKGNQKAQRGVYEFIHPVLKPICLRYASDHQQASEFLNTAAFKILSSLHQLKSEDALLAWAKRIQYQCIFDFHRKAKSEGIQASSIEFDPYSHSPNSPPKADNNSNYEYLLDLVRKLPRTSQFVFNLYAIDGFSHAEIAQHLAISESTSRWHLSEARKRLQAFINQPITEFSIHHG